jgi:hypothetical protein
VSAGLVLPAAAPVAVDQLAAALGRITPSALCTVCVLELKQARMVQRPEPEVHPGVVMANGMLLCEIRHTISAGAPQLFVAQPGQMPGLG